MSCPSDEFSNLNLEGKEMSNRRSIAQQQRRRRENLERQQNAINLQTQQARPVQPYQPTMSQPTSSQVLFKSYTGIRYNSTNMPKPAFAIAKRGLTAPVFTAEMAMRHGSGAGSYFAFQLKNTESVRIFESTLRKPHVECSCQSFKESDICSHIYWLYDGMNHALLEDSKSSVHDLDISSIENRFMNLQAKISDRLPFLPDDLNLRGDDATAEADSTDDFEEVTMIQDMLSVLDDKKLPDDFEQKFMSTVPKFERSYQRTVVPGDIQTTLFGLARHDPILRERLRNAIPKDLCATNFLEKLEARAASYLGRFDAYATRGPNVQAKLVDNCASGLRNIIATISEYKETRPPMSPSLAVRAAEVVLRILTETLNRDMDIYSSDHWRSNTSTPKSLIDRNLFVNLVQPSSGPDDNDDDDDGGEEDVLGFDILGDALIISNQQPLFQSMLRLLARFKEAGAPSEHRVKLHEVLTTRLPPQLASSSYVDPSSRMSRASSISRRPPVEGQRDPQRRRL